MNVPTGTPRLTVLTPARQPSVTPHTTLAMACCAPTNLRVVAAADAAGASAEAVVRRVQRFHS
eukprot:187654-Chlamydomonas_euryale.AAC.1